MTVTRLLELALAFFSAWVGYQLFAWLGFPSAALTGSAAMVTVVALCGLNADLPVPLRNACILVLGVNIGTAVTPEVLATALTWPASLAILTVSVLTTMAISTAALRVIFGYDRKTAMLASAPGHLSFVLSIAAESGLQVSAVAIIQSVRVLFLTLCVPPIVSVVFGATGVSVLPDHVVSTGHMALTFAVAIPVALVFERLRLPAAWLLAGMAVSAVGHGAGITLGRLPSDLGTAALIMMGTLIGSRFSAVRPREVLSYVGPGLLVTSIAVGLAFIGVGVAVLLLGLSPALLTVAFAPGGVEAMAAIALTLGYDPTFVAAHHVHRLIVLSILMPFLFARRRQGA